jgi:hypothetical protein
MLFLAMVFPYNFFKIKSKEAYHLVASIVVSYWLPKEGNNNKKGSKKGENPNR